MGQIELFYDSIQGAEAKYGIIFETFCLISPIFEKQSDKPKFSWLALLSKYFFKIKIQRNISEKEKKRQRIYDLHNAEIKSKKVSEIIGVSLWPLSIPLITLYEAF